MKKRSKIYILLVSVFTIMIAWFVYCNFCEVVYVIDEAGNPIEGARVGAVSLSMNSGYNITSSRGRTTVPKEFYIRVQGLEWIEVKKAGYEYIQVKAPEEWPLTITLKKENWDTIK